MTVVGFAVVAVGLFGLLIGSFLNVVVYRVPLKKSIVSPPSACTHCGTLIKTHDNVPVLSWVLLRGKCRTCRSGISFRYPLVELGTGLLFAVVTWWGISTYPITAGGSLGQIFAFSLTLTAFLYLAAISVTLAVIDLDTHTLPNRIVLPSYIVGIALLGSATVVGGGYEQLLTAGLGLGVLWASYLIMALVYPGGMGFGDVKLAGVLGLFLGWVGWGPLVVGAFGAFLLGGVYSMLLLLTGRAKRTSGIPFGPWMIAGAWVGIFFGNTITSGYLSLFGLE
jgi:leader peptidase (prepilin peptidase)/N-methyltransferase